MTGLNYLRGAFAVFPSEEMLQALPQLIVFRFNPETLSRSFQVESGSAEPGVFGSGRPGQDMPRGADAASGPMRERFSVQVRFDFDDRHEAARLLPENLGISPEIAALEMLLQTGEDSALSGLPKARQGVSPRLRRPTVLFIWGRLRIVPVRITSLTINETLFNAELNPLRAEAEVGVEVVDEGSPMVQHALGFARLKRQVLARLFHATSVAQGASILPL